MTEKTSGTGATLAATAGVRMRDRPLSPHLSVYKFKYTLVTSISHRISGLILSVGLLVLVYWLMAIANGEPAYSRATVVLSHWFFKLVYAGLLVAFVYHLVAGIRHLVWDTGRGLEREQSRRSAWLIGAITLVLVCVLGYFLFFGGADPS